MKTSALTSGALGLGLTGNAVAQNGDDEGTDTDFQPALMFSDEFHAGSVFRVTSPELEDPPGGESGLANYTTQIIEFFNTNQEAYLFVPPDQQVEEGELYVFDDQFTPYTNGDTNVNQNLVQVHYRPLSLEDYPFDLEDQDAFEILEDEGGGEAAIRPPTFFSGALFRITTGPQGWVPHDVEDSGFFTDYNTHHAEFLGTNDPFLFWPQTDADVEVGRLYVMWDEFEFFKPEGNLVATEFDVVNEESLDVDDEFL